MGFMTDIMLLSLLFIPSTLAACLDSTNLLITAPTEMEALSGSCLHIPCNFSDYRVTVDGFDSTRPVLGVWIKNNPDFGIYPNNVIFNSSLTVNIYPMNITGNLTQRNCTTLFSNLSTNYTNTYYFRIMNWPFRATAVCDPLQITIKDSPWRPNITIPGDLKEKESVTITCSALTPCPHSPPQLTWNLTQDSDNKTKQNTDGNFTTKIQQTITLSDTHDGKKISCSARYPVNQGKDTKTAETEETLSVSYAPKDTSASISPSGLVSAGSWVNLTCSSRAKPPVSSFTWFKKSRAISALLEPGETVKVSEGEIYSFNVTDGGVYYCVATNDLGNQTSGEIHVTVKGNDKLWQHIGVIIGIILLLILLCLIIFVCWLKSKHQRQQQTQIQINEKQVVEEPGSKTEEVEENIHYGEINIFMHEASSDSVQDRGQEQDTVYAQVKVTKPENNLTQSPRVQEELYSEVKKI
ncbi:sialic acid-binding Ig-like lectin 7 [Oreochromis niloticus]|uniref:sialic acid-binding Ig-like lectin 7 n=1 Tax=Oreochromis niloticus TaxID=8128 RepID=UPI0009057ACA|nr:sialic acid-binding Ig-like lectin 7 [Oreochromis niloticus]